MAAPDAKRINARAAKDKKFLARALKNPGLRAKLDPKYLSKPQAKARALNTRLNTPIAPGSSTTERDLAHEAEAATTVKYGPQDRAIAQQLGVAQQTQQDTGSFYDQYRQALQQHAQNVQLYQAGAQQALQQTAQGISGLGSQEALQMQQAANQQAAQQGIAPAGDLSQLANAAMATRQGVMGTFQNQQTLQGEAANVYADAQANRVAPAQKLSALAQAAGRTKDVRQKQADLATEKGAYNQQFRQERRADEFKNQLALSTLSGNQARIQADIAANTPAAKAATTAATSAASTASKYGYTPHQWALLGPKGRQRIINASKAQSKSHPDMGKVNQYGYTEEQWRAMSTAQRQQVIKDFKRTTGKTPNPKTEDTKAFRQKYGVDPLPTSAHNTFKNQVSQAQRALKLIGSKDKKGNPITTDAIVGAMTSGGTKGIPKLPAVVIRAALDLQRYGHILPATANRLHHAGYSVATLGYQTSPSTARQTSRNPQGPRTGPGASIPGLGGGR